MTQVLENLFVGSWRSFQMPGSGLDSGLNCAFDLDVEKPPGIEYHKVGLIDGPGNQPRMLHSAVYVLDSLMTRDKPVLAFCHAGKSRSVTVCATWMAWRGKVRSLDAGYERIAAVRPQIDPAEALRKLAAQVLIQLHQHG